MKSTRGRSTKSIELFFRGNHQIAESDLTGQSVVVKKSHLWSHGSVSQKLATQKAPTSSRRCIATADMKMPRSRVRWWSTSPRSTLLFDIDEGPQTLVQNVVVCRKCEHSD